MEFCKDMIGREQTVTDLLKAVAIAKDTAGGITLCLDGDWGCGKTFVLTELERRLEATTEQNKNKPNEPKYYVLHYNCWQHDYYEEPLAAIVSVFQKKLQDHLEALGRKDRPDSHYAKVDTVLSSAFVLICSVMFEVAKKQMPLPKDFDTYMESIRTTGGDIKKVFDLFKRDPKKVFQDHLAPFTAAINDTKEALNKIADEYTVVFVVDELDRCLPSYAIKVLERLHHLFDQQKNCAVIIATDKKQLVHTVHECFGLDTNADVYLKKFIHQTYHLSQKRNKIGMFETKYDSYFSLFNSRSVGYDQLRDYLIELFADTDMRTQELIFTQAEMLHRFLFPKNKLYPASLLLTEITLSFFANHERLNRQDCDWKHLSRSPFLLNEHNQLKLLYENMNDFEIFLRSRWGIPQKCHNTWTIDQEKHFSHALIGCFDMLATHHGNSSVLTYDNCYLTSEMICYANHLRKFW